MRHAAIADFLHSPSGPIHRAVASRVRKTDAIATATAPVGKAKKSGARLKNDRTSGVRDEGHRLVGFVSFNVGYALYVTKGTGIYGPRGQVIKPKTKQFLKFTLPDGTVIYAKSVKGQRPNPFLVDALKAGSGGWPVNEH